MTTGSSGDPLFNEAMFIGKYLEILRICNSNALSLRVSVMTGDSLFRTTHTTNSVAQSLQSNPLSRRRQFFESIKEKCYLMKPKIHHLKVIELWYKLEYKTQ